MRGHPGGDRRLLGRAVRGDLIGRVALVGAMVGNTHTDAALSRLIGEFKGRAGTTPL
jgi:hypothetical protein